MVVWSKDPFMEIKVKARGPEMKLESKPHSEEEDDEEEIPIISSNIKSKITNPLETPYQTRKENE